MSLPTGVLGRFDVDPRLNPAEVEWLRAYAASPVFPTSGDPYAVAMNPRASPVDSRATDGSMESHCDWQPCVDGCCLLWAHDRETAGPGVDPQYLIDHFLRPGAHAAASGRDDFRLFTFDHQISGIVAAEDSETRRLYLLVADGHVVEEHALVPGDPFPW